MTSNMRHGLYKLN